MSIHTPTVVFDFDGTVSLGSGPVLRYAHHAAAGLPKSVAETFLDTVSAALGAASGHPDPARSGGRPGDPQHGDPQNGDLQTSGRPSSSAPRPGTPARVLDGYELVRSMALAQNVDQAALGAAYDRSRSELATDDAPIEPPADFAPFLASLRQHALVVLATNAPAVRLPEALHVLGLTGAFDEIVTSVGKPAGLPALLDRFTREAVDAAGGHAAPSMLLSVGDVWANDLEPAALRGFSTALVGPAWNDPVTPTFRAERLETLYTQMIDWATRGR